MTRDAAVYYRPDPGRWRGALLRPPEPDGDAAGSFERAAAALHAAGLRVNAWIVVAHNGRLARGPPGLRRPERLRGRLPVGAVHRLPGGGRPTRPRWPPRSPRWTAWTRSSWRRAAGTATTTAARTTRRAAPRREHPDGCWTPASARRAPARCGMPASIPARRPSGSGPPWTLPRVTGGGAARPGPRASARAEELGELAGAVTTVRAAAAGAFLHRVLAAVRDAAPGRDVLVHADPDPLAAGANPGYDPAVLLGPDGADGMIVACPGPVTHAEEIVRRTKGRPAPAAGSRLPSRPSPRWGRSPATCPARPRRCSPRARPICGCTTRGSPRRPTTSRCARWPRYR